MVSHLYPRTGTLAPGGVSPCGQGACRACLDLSSAALWAMSFCCRQGTPTLSGAARSSRAAEWGLRGKWRSLSSLLPLGPSPSKSSEHYIPGRGPTSPGIREELLCCALLLLRGICTLCLPSDHGGEDFLPMGGISPTKLLRAQEMF